MLSQEPQKQTICVQSDRGFQGFSDSWQGGSSVGPKGEAGILWMAGQRLSMGRGCCKAVLNRKSIPIFPPHCPEISFPRCVCSLLICFPGLMLPFCSLPLTEGYNSVRCLPSPPQSIGSSVILVPTAGRAGGAWPLLVAGWLPAEKSTTLAVGGSSLSPYQRCLLCPGRLLLSGLWLMVD